MCLFQNRNAERANSDRVDDLFQIQEAGTSHSKKSAKKRAKEARRQAALAQHSSTEPEDGVRGAAVLQEQPEPTVHKSAYQIAREQRDAERTAEELAEAEEIRLAQVRSQTVAPFSFLPTPTVSTSSSIHQFAAADVGVSGSPCGSVAHSLKFCMAIQHSPSKVLFGLSQHAP